ncbi:MAG TPA: hypothetical protein VEX11_09720 [Acetobacteraceae bacterium]|nr:hypothetical protein [Acetobacteraceae bacterium]
MPAGTFVFHGLDAAKKFPVGDGAAAGAGTGAALSTFALSTKEKPCEPP